MNIHIKLDSTGLISGANAANKGASSIRAAINRKGSAQIILATGTSQFAMLEALAANHDLDWSKCSVFHLDEYIGLSQQNDASFVKYLRERFVNRIPSLGHFEAINGSAKNIDDEIRRLNITISENTIDVAFIGIGENGHLAFNDPPADLATESPYIRVSLDQVCRNQQKSEGWFKTINDVPLDAITMSITQIMKSRTIICTVDGARKADAVLVSIEGPLDVRSPASILRKHSDVWLFLDRLAGSKLNRSAFNN